jgi:hypothetical protein
MREPLEVLPTKIEARGETGDCVVSVLIKSAYGEFCLEIPVENATDGLEEARKKVFQFANSLVDRVGDKGSLRWKGADTR